MAQKKKALTPNQLVAHNLRKARELRGWTQEEASERLEPYLGARWSKATFSLAERSVTGKRVREFTADDIVAFSEAFDLPVAWFFMPEMGDRIAVGEKRLNARDMVVGKLFPSSATPLDRRRILLGLIDDYEAHYFEADRGLERLDIPQRVISEAQHLAEAFLEGRTKHFQEAAAQLRQAADTLESELTPRFIASGATRKILDEIQRGEPEE